MWLVDLAAALGCLSVAGTLAAGCIMVHFAAGQLTEPELFFSCFILKEL